MQPQTHKARRQSSLMASLCCVALLAGCGGGEEDASDGTFTITPGPGGSGIFASYYMATITRNWRLAAASFRDNSPRFQLQNGTFNINGQQVFSNPLHSSRVDYAHAVGLTGAGQVISIVDDGFRTTHEAFAGKSNSITGSPAIEDHGTMVASIAAGNSPYMVGVAPGANLAFGNAFGNFQDLTAAAVDARQRGAVAQNNSWGFSNTFINQTGYNAIFGSAPGQAWLSALKDYAAEGVVVFAISNNQSATLAGLMEALPVIETTLEPGWLAVGNAVPVFDDNGVSAVAFRASAPCLEAARWCLMADGYWTAATAATNTSYGSSTGSSFAAPQVSGALALLAQAFPALTPHQLRARLLASADNTFTGFTSAGTMDLLDGPGTFLHAFSNEFGHGFLDIRAALLPIGPVTLALADGDTIETKDFSFSTGGAMGDAVTLSLDGIDLSVSDALGGGFEVAAKSFATEVAPVSLATAVASRTLGKDFATARIAPLNPLADTFAAHPGQTLDLAGPEGRVKAAVLIGSGDDYGLALSQTVTDGDLQLDLGVKLARDSGSVMGFSGQGDTGGADMAALTVALTNDTGSGGFFALSGEMGLADLGAPRAISDVSLARFNSLSLDIGSRNVFARDDRLTLGLSMPVAVTSGAASMMVPVALGDGLSEVRSIDVNLAPQERQMELSISYQMPMGERSEMLFEVVHAENYGNRAGVSDSAAMIGIKWSF
ncbi:S8 family peptidase [Tabrizicola sp.]|uniref:S8 family peptidase n=1 Tax=Tabrizicola sp. TaxID=2005166 RepID=UPI00262D1755|nr:S8 family peptidase [Tabrizicola sp.]MDM7930719.1 S8 family peptidase [Tabrizicola sp.]